MKPSPSQVPTVVAAVLARSPLEAAAAVRAAPMSRRRSGVNANGTWVVSGQGVVDGLVSRLFHGAMTPDGVDRHTSEPTGPSRPRRGVGSRVSPPSFHLAGLVPNLRRPRYLGSARPRVTLALMASPQEQTGTPSLDEWIAEVGEEEVVAVVKASVRDIENGTTPGFTDKEAFSAYVGRGRRTAS